VTRRRPRQSCVVGLLTGWCLISALGCQQEAAAPVPAIPEVGVVTVGAQTIPDDPEFIGRTEASRVVEIRSQVTGVIKAFFYREGRDVKKGDRLYQIDPVPFQAAMASAQAVVAQVEARATLAKQNLARVVPLLAEQAVSRKDVDDAVAEELTADAALEAAKGHLVKARFDLDNTLIVAPLSGLIEQTRLYEGRLVSAQTDLLTIIHQVDPMYVVGSAPESYLLQRRRELVAKTVQQPGLYQLKGRLTFMDGTPYPHEGRLDFAAVGLSTETGSRQARFVFSNRDRLLLPGQFVNMRVTGSRRPDAILVPQRAVQQGPKGSLVFVVGADDKVEIRRVQATGWRGDQWLIEDGLRAGEQIVVDGIHRIAPGVPVKAMPVTMSAP